MDKDRLKKIDINEWQLSGGGHFGDSYFRADNPDIMLKMLSNSEKISLIESELEISRVAWELGVPTPEPGELVTDGINFGITFRRLPGKVSYARAVGNNPDDIDALARNYARTVKEFHSHHCSDPRVRKIKDLYSDYIQRNDFHGDRFKSAMLKILDSLPDGDSFLHGDLHFGNIVMSGGRDYFIDMGGFCCGYPLFDLGMNQAILLVSNSFPFSPSDFEREFHCTLAQGARFRDAALNEYFGRNIDPDEAAVMIAPYTAMRMVAMEMEVNCPLNDDCWKAISEKYCAIEW